MASPFMCQEFLQKDLESRNSNAMLDRFRESYYICFLLVLVHIRACTGHMTHTGELRVAAPSSLCLPIRTASERFRSRWSAAESARCTVPDEDGDPGQVQNLMAKISQLSFAYRSSNAVSRTLILYHRMSVNVLSQ